MDVARKVNIKEKPDANLYDLTHLSYLLSAGTTTREVTHFSSSHYRGGSNEAYITRG